MDILSPKSHLKVGLEGTIKNEHYKIIGRIKYSSFDTEEGRRYLWDEWLLISQYGRQLWLSEDEWKFHLSSAFSPKTPFDPKTVKNSIIFEGKNIFVIEKGNARIEFFEGELNYKPVAGDEISYLDMTQKYSVEWDESEIKFYKSEEIPVEQVYKAFNLNPNLIPLEAYQKPQYLDADQEMPKPVNVKDDRAFYHYDSQGLLKTQMTRTKNNVCNILFISGILLILLSVYFVISTQEVALYHTSLMDCKEDKDGKIFGPIKFDRAKVNYTIKIDGDIGFETDYNMAIELLDEADPDDNQALLTKVDSFWSVEVEGEESDYESKYNSLATDFYLDKPGEYYLRVIIDGDDNEISGRSLTIVIYKSLRSRYYFWSGFFLLLIAVFML